MPKVRTYRCSLCTYKSKDKTKVEKHTRLHNVFHRDSEEKSESSAENDDASQSSDIGSSEVELDKSKTSISDTETAMTSPVKPQTESQSEQSKPMEHEQSVTDTLYIQPKLEPPTKPSSPLKSPSKNVASPSPSKLSRSNLSRTRPLDTAMFPSGKSPSPKKKSLSQQLPSTPPSRDVTSTPKGLINAAYNTAKSPVGRESKNNSKCRVLALAQLEMESLEEIRYRYYVDRLRIKDETAEVKDEPTEVQVKEEVLDCEHEVQPTLSVQNSLTLSNHSADVAPKTSGLSETLSATASSAVSTSSIVPASSLGPASSAVSTSSTVPASSNVRTTSSTVPASSLGPASSAVSAPLTVPVSSAAPASSTVPSPSNVPSSSTNLASAAASVSSIGPASAAASVSSIGPASSAAPVSLAAPVTKWMQSVLQRKHPIAGSSGNISKKRKKKERARILSEDLVGEIVPEFVSEEQAYNDLASSNTNNTIKRTRINEDNSTQGAVHEKVGYLKNLDTGKVSCRINQDTVMSIKRGLLGNIAPNQQPLSPSTSNLAMVTSPTTTNSMVEVCSARLVPLSQPPLVAPLTVPVTDLLTVSNTNKNLLDTSTMSVLNIPLRVGGVLSQPPPVLLPVSVWPATQNQSGSIPAILPPPAAWLPSIPVSQSAPSSSVSQIVSVPPCTLTPAPHPENNPAMSKTIQPTSDRSSDTDSVVNVLIELEETTGKSSSPGPRESSNKTEHPKEVGKEPLKEVTVKPPSGPSPSAKHKSETAKHAGLIVPPNNTSTSPTLVETDRQDTLPVESDVSLNGANMSSNPKNSHPNGRRKSISNLRKPTTKHDDSPLQPRINPDRPSPLLKEKHQHERPPPDRSGNLPSEVNPDYSEEMKEIKSMLLEVNRMLKKTGVLINKVTEKVAKLESRMGDE